MSEFELYFTTGLTHVLDINGYDHVLYLTVLALPYMFKDWKKILLLVTLFTIGHTASLLLSVYGVLSVNSAVIEFLIPVTIMTAAIYNVIKGASKGSAKQNGMNFLAITTLFFGLIHGLGFSNFFKIILAGNSDSKLLPLLEFALGIEAAQIIVVLVVLVVSFIVQEFLRFPKRDWVLVMSAFVAGIVLPIIFDRAIW